MRTCERNLIYKLHFKAWNRLRRLLPFQAVAIGSRDGRIRVGGSVGIAISSGKVDKKGEKATEVAAIFSTAHPISMYLFVEKPATSRMSLL